MGYDFSAQFLRVIPPDTNFGQAWESLCFDLLRAEFNGHSLIRFNPPDNGVDILHKDIKKAYQCKSDERGAFGSLSHVESINSLQTACKNRHQLRWEFYCFATNANYTGAAFSKIMEESRRLDLKESQIEFYGPEYWDDLCSKHFNKVSNRLDYRISVTEKQVIDAFKKARYFDKYIKEYESLISSSKFSLVIKNNRTPIELEIPFSPELSVENCLDVTKELLGISLDWTNYSDLGTSAGPSLSLTINRYAQGFSKKIKELNLKEGDNLELWIKIIWEDEQQKKGVDSSKVYFLYFRTIPYKEILRKATSYQERKQHTLQRTEQLIQTMIWKNAKELKTQVIQLDAI